MLICNYLTFWTESLLLTPLVVIWFSSLIVLFCSLSESIEKYHDAMYGILLFNVLFVSSLIKWYLLLNCRERASPEGDVSYMVPLEKTDIRFGYDRSEPLFDVSRSPLLHFHHYERANLGLSNQVYLFHFCHSLRHHLMNFLSYKLPYVGYMLVRQFVNR